MVVQHNLSAMNSMRMLGLTTASVAGVTEKLSSGYKVNRAADDAAGLAISEKMRRQIRGLTQASANAEDGISMVQTAEGGLNEVHDMLQRLNELSVKASNGTLTEADREYTNQEFSSLKKEINRVADSTTFNEIQLFPSDGSSMVAESYTIKVNGDGTNTVSMNTDSYTVGDVSATGNATKAAEYIKGLIPGIVGDILGAYTNLKGADDLEIKLDMSYIDGGNNTLAFAQYSYYKDADRTPVKDSFLVKVDTADFTDSNSLDTAPNNDRNELLKATLRHELTHTVMQYTLSKSMQTDMPQWFVEGAAQVSGGGFSTGWLSELANITNGMTTGDTSKDSDIANYLKKYSVDSRPYGHGFLATAYAAQLASGSSDVTPANMAAGLNRILGELKNGSSFADAIKNTTGKTVDEIKNAINKGEPGAVAFAREYSIASEGGAGSALLGDFKLGKPSIGGVPADASAASDLNAAASVFLQVGTENDPAQRIEVNLFSIGTKSLGIHDSNVLTAEAAKASIDAVKNGIQVISTIRSYYGATQNRIEHTIKNLDNVVENTTAAESQIRDTDMATAMVKYSNLNILAQAGQSMLAQANQSNQGVLSLLQ